MIQARQLPVILHHDAMVVIVDKPSGWPVIATRDASEPHLHAWLQESLGIRLWVVHRIDRETSGVVLFACHAAAHRRLCAQFEHRQVEKRYQALVAGKPLPEAIDIRLALHAARKGKMRPALAGEHGALAAHSRVQVRVRWRPKPATDLLPAKDPLEEFAQVEVQPHSGRQHQIRVHLRSLDAPLLCDPLYQPGELAQQVALALSLPIKRLALHACALAFDHPERGRVHYEAPLPADFLHTIAALDKMSSD